MVKQNKNLSQIDISAFSAVRVCSVCNSPLLSNEGLIFLIQFYC